VHGDVGGVVIEDPRPSGRRRHQSHQDLDRRRLAGAVAAEEAEDLTTLDGQRHAIERPDTAEVQEPGRIVLGEALELDGAHPRGTVEARCSVTSQPRGLTTST
jgi:hypothetical protein